MSRHHGCVTALPKPGPLRDAIAESLATELKAYDVAEFCERLGLAPQREAEDPFRSKFVYVKSRLQSCNLSELLDIARRILEEWDDAQLQSLIEQARTARGEAPSPHRPFSPAEVERRDLLAAFLDVCSEDELIEEVLLPLFRQLGYHRITAAGHKDKALEYGKDIWMRYTLPTQNFLYFGIQAKKGKIDAAGKTKTGNVGVAEIHHQALMMLANEIFDPELNRRVLVDHAYIVAGGEITKQARGWLANALDASKRSQIMFMDREDILNLYVVSGLPLPPAAVPPSSDPWGPPPF